MRLLSFHADNSEQFGAIVDERVVSLSERMPEYATLRNVLEAGALVRAMDIAASSSADYAVKDIRFRPPITSAGKILCVERNYRSGEGPADEDGDPFPSVFLRTQESLVGHREPLVKPLESDQYDYEGAIALIIGREGRRIPRDQAYGHVAGLTLVNDGSVRDWMGRGRFDVTPGKNFERSGAMGPWLVTADDCSPSDDLRLVTRVNEALRQEDHTARLRFPFDYLISYLSTFVRLKPGDVIVTGTPAGFGASLAPPEFLLPGDRVSVEVEGIGVLENPVEAEAEAPG